MALGKSSLPGRFSRVLFTRTLLGMYSSQLSRKQLDALPLRLAPMLDCLHAMQARMKQQQFPADDPLATSTAATIAKLQQLMDAIHVLAVTAEEPGYFVGYEWRRG